MEIAELTRKIYKTLAIGIGTLLLFICVLIFITSPVSANQIESANATLNTTEITSSSITWHYTYLTDNRPTGATLDGVLIENFQTDLVYNYTATDLTPNTTHEFCLFKDLSICLSDTTLTDSSSDIQIWNFILMYIFLIAGIVCLAIGIKIPLVSFMAFVFGVLGILQSLNNSFYMGTLYVILIIASLFVAFNKD